MLLCCFYKGLDFTVAKWDDTPSTSPRSEIDSVSSVSLESSIISPVKKYIQGEKAKSPPMEFRSGVKKLSTLSPIQTIKTAEQLTDRGDNQKV